MSCFRNSVHLLFRFLFFVAMGRSERVALTPFRPRNFSPLLFFLFRFSFFIFWLVSPRILKTVLCSHVSWHPMKIKVENSLFFFDVGAIETNDDRQDKKRSSIDDQT